MDKLESRKRRVDSEDYTESKKSKTESTNKQANTTKGGNSKIVCKFDLTPPTWKEIRAENLVCDYCILFDKSQADDIFTECEQILSYNDGDLSKIKIYGKWMDIPRKQV